MKPSVEVYMIKSIHSATFIQGKYGMWLCKKPTTLNGLCYTVMQIGIFKKRLNYKNNSIYSNVISSPTSSTMAKPLAHRQHRPLLYSPSPTSLSTRQGSHKQATLFGPKVNPWDAPFCSSTDVPLLPPLLPQGLGMCHACCWKCAASLAECVLSTP